MAQHKHAVGVVNSVPPHPVAWQVVICGCDRVKPSVGCVTVLFDICLICIEGHIEGVSAVACNSGYLAIIFAPVSLSERAQEGPIGHIESGHASIVGVNADVKNTCTLSHGDWITIWQSVRPSLVIVPCASVPMGDRTVSELTELTDLTTSDNEICAIGPQFVNLVASIAGQARSGGPFCQPLARGFIVPSDAVFSCEHHFAVVFDDFTDWEIKISIIPFSEHSAVCGHVLEGVFTP